MHCFPQYTAAAPTVFSLRLPVFLITSLSMSPNSLHTWIGDSGLDAHLPLPLQLFDSAQHHRVPNSRRMAGHREVKLSPNQTYCSLLLREAYFSKYSPMWYFLIYCSRDLHSQLNRELFLTHYNHFNFQSRTNLLFLKYTSNSYNSYLHHGSITDIYPSS